MFKLTIRIIIFATLTLTIFQGCINDWSFDLFPNKPLNKCKSSCFIFEGRVYDPNNSEPILAPIELIYQGDGFLAFANELGWFLPDSNGYYAVNFDGTDYQDGTGYFILKATRDGYLTNDIDGRVEISDMDSTNFDVPVIADILLRPQATLRFNFEISKPDQLQLLSYTYQYAQKKYEHPIFSEKWGLDTLYSHPVAGDQFVYTWINYKENNQSYSIQDSIYLRKGETKLIKTKIN